MRRGNPAGASRRGARAFWDFGPLFAGPFRWKAGLFTARTKLLHSRDAILRRLDDMKGGV